METRRNTDSGFCQIKERLINSDFYEAVTVYQSIYAGGYESMGIRYSLLRD